MADVALATVTQQSQQSCCRIAIFTCFLNAGMSTRCLEIAKALRQLDQNAQICFFSRSGPSDITYEYLALEEGFEIMHYGSPIDKERWTNMLAAEHDNENMEKYYRMEANCKGAMAAIKDYKPDVVVHGVLPDVAVAAQILHVPNVLYAPIPFWDKGWMRQCLVKNKQSAWWTGTIPLFIYRHLVEFVMNRKREARYKNIIAAAKQCGWEPDKSGTLFQCNTYILTELPSNYSDYEFGLNVKIIGPLFANSTDSKRVIPLELKEHLAPEVPKKIFVTMGSSGSKDHIVEAVKALCMGNFNAIVLLPPGRCSAEDVKQALRSDGIVLPTTVHLREDFLPADKIASLVDCVIGHGGQGTVQMALAAGKPIVGTPMQREQAMNLENYVVKSGSGFSIPKEEWKADRIHAAVSRVLSDSSYALASAAKQEEIQKALANSAQIAASTILQVATAGKGNV